MIGSQKYQLSADGCKLYSDTVKIIDQAKYPHITNPCSEANLNIRGAYCTLSDIVPFFCDTFDEIKETAKLAIRFLIRTNLMDAMYADEVKRTNRVGLGITAIHEFAYKFFGYGFRDLIDEKKSQNFWNFVDELRIAIEEEGCRYSDELGVNHPHTFNVVKPSGSISKLFALTEGAHLPAYRWYLRWVQFQNNDPLLQEYKDKGYPVKSLISYPNVSIVGFLTKPIICSLGMGDKLVTAQEATPEEQYKWIMLLEKYWLGPNGGQCSYTLKVATDKVSLEQFREMFRKYQPLIRCCTVLPITSVDTLKTIYEYLPEEEITEDRYNQIENQINNKSEVRFSVEELICSSGSCPL